MKNKIITDLKYLKQKSQEATPKEAQDIIKELEENLDLKKGIGLSAIQIGILKRVGIIRIPQLKKSIDLINAEILEKDGKFRFEQEGCLSIPGLKVDTVRYEEILLYNNDKKFIVNLSIDGILCIAIQHEIAHFNGRTILDDKWKKRR